MRLPPSSSAWTWPTWTPSAGPPPADPTPPPPATPKRQPGWTGPFPQRLGLFLRLRLADPGGSVGAGAGPDSMRRLRPALRARGRRARLTRTSLLHRAGLLAARVGQLGGSDGDVADRSGHAGAVPDGWCWSAGDGRGCAPELEQVVGAARPSARVLLRSQ